MAKQRRHAPRRRVAKRRIAAGAGLGLTAALGATGTAQADVDVITVTSKQDDGTGGVTLREAIEDAAFANDGDTDIDRILFASNVTGTITLNGTPLTVDEPLRIQGPGAASLTVDGGDASRILGINTAASEPVTISGLTLRDGVDTNGGAIYKQDALLTVAGSVITSNEATGPGEGGAIHSELGDVRINDSVLSGNDGSSGGAVWSKGEKVSLKNSTLSGNTITGSGAAVYAYDTDTTVASSMVTGNTAGSGGGGIYAVSNTSVSDVSIAGSTLSGNDANGGVGGGAYVEDGLLEVVDSTLSGNTSDSSGGALEDNNGELVLRRSTVSGNVADSAGGGVQGMTATIDRSTISGNRAIGAVSHGGGLRANYAEITNSTFSGNTADGAGANGGGMSVQEILEIDGSTVVENSSDDADGGGIYVFPGVAAFVTNTIVANNDAGDQGPDLFGDAFQIEFSLIEDATDAIIVETLPGSDLIGFPPQLGPLVNNGGPTRTHKPVIASPVVDFGSSLAAGVDQRGQPRPFDVPTITNPPLTGADGTDIGAVELTEGETAPPLPRCAGKKATIVPTGFERRLNGTRKADVIVGSNSINVIHGRGGNDRICGRGGNDKLFGGRGRDRIFGQAGKDRLVGGPGRDKLRGGPGVDRLIQ